MSVKVKRTFELTIDGQQKELTEEQAEKEMQQLREKALYYLRISNDIAKAIGKKEVISPLAIPPMPRKTLIQHTELVRKALESNASKFWTVEEISNITHLQPTTVSATLKYLREAKQVIFMKKINRFLYRAVKETPELPAVEAEPQAFPALAKARQDDMQKMREK